MPARQRSPASLPHLNLFGDASQAPAHALPRPADPRASITVSLCRHVRWRPLDGIRQAGWEHPRSHPCTYPPQSRCSATLPVPWPLRRLPGRLLQRDRCGLGAVCPSQAALGAVGTSLSRAEQEQRGVASPGGRIQGKQVQELPISIPSEPQRPCPAVPKAPAGSLLELGTAAWDAWLVPPTTEPWSGSWPRW